jgi:hypothetical protein
VSVIRSPVARGVTVVTGSPKPSIFRTRSRTQQARVSLNGCFLRYTAVPEDHGFLRIPDWTEIRRGEPIVRRVAEAVNGRRTA